MENSAAQARYDRVFEIIMAGWGSQAVRTLAELSVAEHLETQDLSAEEIARRESTDPAMTYRLLRAGVALGMLEYDADSGRFHGTPLLNVLHKDSEISLKYYAMACVNRALWLPALYLPEAVRTGHSQAEKALGADVFGYLSQHQDEGRTFGAAMTNLSGPVIREAVPVIDVGEARTVVDVGGAEGAFAAELIQRHAQLSGLILDLPHAMPGVAEEAARRGLSDRITGVPGDFFEAVPSGDIYLLKFILHDWDDGSCVEILSNIRAAMNPGARLFIVEMAVGGQGASLGAALMDMGMLFGHGGKERELAQFDGLVKAARMRTTRVIPIRNPYHVIEVEAALSLRKGGP
jgi:hypothetical protein